MSSIDGDRPGMWNSAGTLDPTLVRKSTEMRSAFEKAAKGEEKGMAGQDSAGDKASAKLDREPSIGDLKQGAALDTKNASRARFEEIRAAHGQRGMSRDLDLSR